MEVIRLSHLFDIKIFVLVQDLFDQQDGYGLELNQHFFQSPEDFIIDLIHPTIDTQRLRLFQRNTIIVHQLVIVPWKFNVVLPMVMHNVAKMK